MEHPFFVFDRGWSSCSPSKSDQRFGLPCHQLNRGDRCISLTQKHLLLQRSPPPRCSTPVGDSTPGEMTHESSPSGRNERGESRGRRSSGRPDSEGGDIDVTAVSGGTPTGELSSSELLLATPTCSAAISQTGSTQPSDDGNKPGTDERAQSTFVSVDSPGSEPVQRPSQTRDTINQ